VLITPRRVVVLGLVLAIAAVGAGGAPAKHKPPKKPVGPPVTPTQPCTYLTNVQVQKAFGGPVTLDPTDRNNKVPNACAYLVGADPLLPTGVLVSTNQFPGFLVPPGESAIDVVEAQRAIDNEDGYSTIDANLGKSSYIDNNLSIIYVAPTSQFAFSLQWVPAGQPSTGGPLSAADRNDLVALAKNITARAPKS
jgi:hypothetical protein